MHADRDMLSMRDALDQRIDWAMDAIELSITIRSE